MLSSNVLSQVFIVKCYSKSFLLRTPCLFKRKGAFISLSCLVWGKSFCTSTRSCARANYANIVRSRVAQCKTEELKVWNSAYQESKEFFLVCIVLRNAFQFAGILVSPVTFLLWPLPLFSLVESLILLALYVSQTMSTRLLDWRWFRMNIMKTFSA